MYYGSALWHLKCLCLCSEPNSKIYNEYILRLDHPEHSLISTVKTNIWFINCFFFCFFNCDHNVLIVSRPGVKWKDSPITVWRDGFCLFWSPSFELLHYSHLSRRVFTFTGPISSDMCEAWNDSTPKGRFPSWDSCLCLSTFKEWTFVTECFKS